MRMTIPTASAAAPARAVAFRLSLFLIAFVGSLAHAGAVPRAALQGETGRVIVLGIDGGDARTVRELIDAGQLPHLAALAQKGVFAPLSTTNPAESPVSWSSLNCGQNPAKTGILGFAVRSYEEGRARALPSIGFYGDEERERAEVRGAPLFDWSPLALGLAAALAVLVLFLLLFRALLRVRTVPAVILSGALAALAGFGGARMAQYVPKRYPVITNLLDATPFWETAAKHGVRGVVLDAAQAWDRDDFDGCEVLSGLGVPDARGAYNGFTLYTTDEFTFARSPTPDSQTPSAGNRLRLERRDSKLIGRVFGPRDFWSIGSLRERVAELDEQIAKVVSFKRNEELEAEKFALEERLTALEETPLAVPLEIELEAQAARVSIDGHEQRLELGRWSEFYPLRFELNPLVKVHALARAKILAMEPDFELYLDTLQIDPAHPPYWQPISQPPDFSKRLAKAIGPYETVGWACMNLPYKDGIVDVDSFLEDIEFTYQWRRALTLTQLERDDWRLFYTCFSTPDRVQHMTYQFYDPEHPLYVEEKALREVNFFGQRVALKDAIPAIYRAVDRLVGEISAKLRPDDTLLICSDHGFQSFRRQVHLNNWLVENGYLKLKPALSKGQSDLVVQYADLAQSRAYAIGLGTLFLNLKGREEGGIVEPADAPALLDEIASKLRALRDENGLQLCSSVTRSSAVHAGKHLEREADLLVGFAPGYRVSWLTTTGGISLVTDEEGAVKPGPAVVDNDLNWSGDHVSVDPEHVRGLFFSSKPFKPPAQGFDLRHVAPTVLDLLGVPIPSEYDLPPLE